MKLVRFGAAGAEQPGIVDATGTIRSLVGHAADFSGAGLSPAALAKIAAIDPTTLPTVPASTRIGSCVAGTRNFIAVGLNYADHAAESGMAVPKEPVLFNKAPFIDRAPARPLVDEAVSLAGRRVLVVRGREAVGKSHLTFFVRHLVDAMPGTRMALVRLDEIEAERVQARDLMEALAASMGLVPDPAWDPAAQDARQADKLARWLVGKLNAGAGNGRRWVIVIDEIDHPRIAPGAIDLVNRLVKAAARGDLVDTSLVAIALPGEVPPGVAADVMEQELAPLTSTEVRAHVDELARTLGVALAPAQLDALAGFAMEGLQFPLDRSGMETVRRRIGQLPEQILQVAA